MLELNPKQKLLKKKKVTQMKFSFSGLIKRFDMAKKKINDLKLGQKKFT